MDDMMILLGFGVVAGGGLALAVTSVLPQAGALERALRLRDERKAEVRRPQRPRTAENPWTSRIRLAGFQDSIGDGRRLGMYGGAMALFAAGLVMAVTRNPLAALLAAGALFAGPFMIVDRMAARTASQMERQVPAFIDAVGSALPIEGNVQQAVLRMAMVTPEPLGPEILHSLKRMALSNESLSEAIAAAGEATSSASLRQFAQAVFVAERDQGSGTGESSIQAVILAMAARLRERETKLVQRRRDLLMPMGMYNLFLTITVAVIAYSMLRPSVVAALTGTMLGRVVLASMVTVVPGTYLIMRAMTSTGDITAKKKGA